MSGETGRTMVIGIAGGTGSGKTTVTRKIKEYFGEDVSVIYHDSYYKRHDELPYEERVKLNYDHPDAFDTAMMAEDLRRLKLGRRYSARSTITPSTTAPGKQRRSAPPRWSSPRESLFSRTPVFGSRWTLRSLWTPTPTPGSSGGSFGT